MSDWCDGSSTRRSDDCGWTGSGAATACAAWCEMQAADALPESGLGEAVHDVLNQAEALSGYLDDGRLAIDNNTCERSLRGNAIGRKNWLLIGSQAAGRAAAASGGGGHVQPHQQRQAKPDRADGLPQRPFHPPARNLNRNLTQFLPDHWQPPA
ncbi:MAG: transposase [Phycisphaeraceae bacterium]|nr:transposase [Phycisphaeraceae bacterium]